MSPTEILNCPEWNDEWNASEREEKLARIATNAKAVFDSILKTGAGRRFLSHGDLKTWHQRLFRNVVPVPYYAGNYRSNDRRHPCLNVEVHVNGLYGAPAAQVPERMSAFSKELDLAIKQTDKYVAGPASEIQKAAAVVQLAAITGGRIIEIHPFRNGNGRIARIAMSWCFHRYGYRMPFPFVSRPPGVLDYPQVSAAAMQHDFNPLFRYLLTLHANG